MGALVRKDITLDWLIAEDACSDQREQFEATFGDRAEIGPEVLAKAAQAGLDLDWFAERILTATAWAAYQQARVPAWAAYQQATATAWAAYEQTTAADRAAFEQTRATALITLLTGDF